MTCRECDEFLSDYLSGELPVTTREVFESHLSRCRNCVTYMEQYRETIIAGKRACEGADADAPAEMPEELIQAILAARKHSPIE
jgi:anti-sigma factor RsiW